MRTVVPSGILLALAVTFSVPASAAAADDPAGDVLRVLVAGSGGDATGDYEPVDGHADVDIIAAEDQDAGDALRLVLTVAGTIRQEGTAQGGASGLSGQAFVYQFSLDLRGDATEDARVTFDAGGAEVGVDGGEPEGVDAQRDRGVLIFTVPWTVLGAAEKDLNWTAAAMEWHGEFAGGAYRSEQFVDVLGPFPELRGAFDFERTVQDLEFEPGFEIVLAAVALLVVAAAWSKR
jgi:hypothetical protein